MEVAGLKVDLACWTDFDFMPLKVLVCLRLGRWGQWKKLVSIPFFVGVVVAEYKWVLRQ